MKRLLPAILAALCSVNIAAAGMLQPSSAPVIVNTAPNLNTFALVGTSREAQQQYFGNSSWNYLNQANAQDGQKYQLIYDGGVSGYTSRQFFAGGATQAGQVGKQFGIGLAGALASRARFVILGGIVNDSLSYTAQQIWDNTVSGGEAGLGYLQAIRAISANGQIPVLQGEYGTNTMTGAKVAQIMAWNQIARQYCSTGACIYLDFPSAIWNPTTTTATTLNFIANTTQDNTHPNQLGGYLLGKVFVSTFSSLVPALPHLSNGLADSGLPNSTFATQTGGTLSGAGTLSSGAVPSGWTLTIPSGVSVVSIFVSDPGGFGYDWQLVLTNAAGVNPAISISSNFVGSPAAGQQYWGGAYISVASASNALEPSCAAQSWYGAGWQYYQTDLTNTPSVALYGPSASSYSFTCKTPIPNPAYPVQVASPTLGNAAVVTFMIAPAFTANGAATITIARPWLRLVQ